MKEYALYVESGPRMKTTMVHVPELPGCIANARTTEAALEATPTEIREFLRFLKRRGEAVEPEDEFSTTVAQHVMEGSWIGYGDPAPGFETDFEPLTRKELAVHLRRLRWIAEELAAIARETPRGALGSQPENGRPVQAIFAHVAAAEPEYARTGGVGKPGGTREMIRAIEAGEAVPANLERLFAAVASQFEAATEDMLARVIQRGQSPYTARRGLRRALEHPWEHLREIQRRLAAPRVHSAAGNITRRTT